MAVAQAPTEGNGTALLVRVSVNNGPGGGGGSGDGSGGAGGGGGDDGGGFERPQDLIRYRRSIVRAELVVWQTVLLFFVVWTFVPHTLELCN